MDDTPAHCEYESMVTGAGAVDQAIDVDERVCSWIEEGDVHAV